GTATTLAAISQKINNYETANLHKQEVNLEEINNIFNNIKNSSKKDLQKLMPFEPERAEIILSGTMVIKEIIAYFEANKILVSDKGLQYGILNLPHKKLKEYLGKK
ncbi:MAG: hypothetical protein SVM86_07095, partial [Candidatus Cloacimonadota bacterium]|nr:hypothetical protein [Candidatus Cloacimonadota bacterium]